MRKIKDTKAKIIRHRAVGSSYYELTLRCPEIAVSAQPGQFINLRVNEGYDPMLRRPFSIHDVNGREIKLLYAVVGKGSEMLAEKKIGECLGVIGPLGNGFEVKPARKEVILAAGGMGVAPLYYLAKKILGVTKSPSHQVTVLIGAKAKEGIICEKDFKKLGCQVKISTDDGSIGFFGRVTELLKNELLTGKRANGQTGKHLFIYACGPKPMLKELSIIARENNIKAQVSLEEHMSCGFGACLGCVVNTSKGYKRVCKEGPVFDAQEIIW